MAKFCSSCAKCSSEPYDGDTVKRYCGATPEKRAQHAANAESGLMGYWMRPDEWTYSNSTRADRCTWYEPIAPRFSMVSCSQCGGGFGPGNVGFSHCKDHANLLAVED